jgi:hypothetical protein
LLLSSSGDTGARTATLASAAANAAILIALAPSYTLTGTPAVSVDVADDYVWTGAHTFASTITARHVLPQYTDTYDIGSVTLWWRQQFVSQINATIFAKETVQLYGGGLMVTKNAVTLPAVGASQTQIDFGQSMTPGDFLLIRAHDASGAVKVEYMTVGGLVSGTTYNVTRDVAGAHVTNPAWADGTPAAVLGQSGNGRIELNAYTSPRLSVIVQGATYNSQSEYIRLGDLNGMPGVTSTKWGIFIGDASQYLRYYDGALVIAGNGSGLTAINGGNITTGTVTAAQIAAGTITADRIAANTITGDRIALTSYFSINNNTFGADGIQLQYNGGNPRAYIGNGGDRYFQFDGTTISWRAANAQLDASGNLSASNATMSGAINATSGSITGILSISGSGAIFASGTTINVSGIEVTSSLQSIWQPDRGYKFVSGGVNRAGLTHQYESTGATASVLTLYNNYNIDTGSTLDSGKSSTLRIKDQVAGANASYIEILSRNSTHFSQAVAGIGVVGSTSFINLTASTIELGGYATVNGNAIWHAGNDGAGSGLDADLLDGAQGLQYARLDSTQTITGYWVFSNSPTLGNHMYRNMYSTNEIYDHYYPSGGNGANYSAINMRFWNGAGAYRTLRIAGNNSITWEGGAVWHAGNDGSGSTLDADLLDGNHAANFAMLSGATFTGGLYKTTTQSGIGPDRIIALVTSGALAAATGNDQMYLWHMADNEMAIGVADSYAWRTLVLQPYGGTVDVRSYLFASSVGYDWSELTPVNNWVNYGGGAATLGIKRFGNMVSVKGFVRATTSIASLTSVCSQLPAEYRPILGRHFLCAALTGGVESYRRVFVTTTGYIQPVGAFSTNEWISLEFTYFTGG